MAAAWLKNHFTGRSHSSEGSFFSKSKDLRTPSAQETKNVLELLLQLKTAYDDGSHEALLFRLWACVSPSKVAVTEEGKPVSHSSPPYARVSMNWRVLGFQRDDPAIDFRGGGVLALKSLIYFCEIYRGDALEMLSNASYSWALFGLNACRLVFLDLLAIDVRSMLTYSEEEEAHVLAHLQRLQRSTMFWDLFETKAGYYELFCWILRQLERKFILLGANEMDFMSVLAEVARDCQSKLLRSGEANAELAQLLGKSERSIARDWVACDEVADLPQAATKPWTRWDLVLLQNLHSSATKKVGIANERLKFVTQSSMQRLKIQKEIRRKSKEESNRAKDADRGERREEVGDEEQLAKARERRERAKVMGKQLFMMSTSSSLPSTSSPASNRRTPATQDHLRSPHTSTEARESSRTPYRSPQTSNESRRVNLGAATADPLSAAGRQPKEVAENGAALLRYATAAS